MISVLSPSYNYARWLPDTLSSVAEQHASAVEHIVVDDGSTDDSMDVLRSWSGPLILRLQENQGISATLNRALSLAQGDWFGWLNSDDFYLPDTFTSVREAIDANPEAAMIWGDSVYVDQDARMMRLVAQHPTNRRVLRLMGTHIAPCATFVRRSAVPEGVFDTELRVLMDWDLSLAILTAGNGPMVYLPRPLGAFRRHGQQAGQPASIPEHNRVRERYGLPTNLRLRRLANRYGMLEHAAHKAMTGGYARQRRVRHLAGRDLRWWLGREQLGTARALATAAR